MLRKLGRSLTVLNMVVSGAILVAMAFMALGVSERTMTQKYTGDLSSYALDLLSVLSASPDATGSNVLMQIPSDYLVYYDGMSLEDQPIIAALLEATQTELSQVQQVYYSSDSAVNMEASQFISVNKTDITLPDDGTVVLDALGNTANYSYFTVIGSDATDESMQSDGSTPVSITTNIMGSVHHVEGISYRVAATMLSLGDQEQTLLVAQDMTKELQDQNSQRLIYALLVGAGLVGILCASVLLSRHAIAPVETSIHQQHEFVAAASHELRTPIAAIRANAEVLSDAELSPTYEKHLQSITQESLRMSHLIADLMQLARADAGELPMEMQLVDLSDVAKRAADLVEPLATQKELTLIQNRSTALIQGDSERLGQILLILLDNAIQYTPAGGSIDLCTGQSKGNAFMRVSDSGEGIAPELKQRIFDRFYRAEKARTRQDGNAGLGLSIAKQLTEQMHGSISVSNREGGGSIFEVCFAIVKKQT